MKHRIKLLTGIIAVTLTALISSCTSTEVIEPATPETKGNTITLNISCPDTAPTRADSDPHYGHVLRYSAILYAGSELKTGTLYDRQEETMTTGESKEFTFIVPEGDYSCVVFADYIPNNSQPNDKGLYKDKYYNTENPRERIYMRSFLDFSTYGNGNKTVDEKCFNNENYDCFAYHAERIKKGTDEKMVEVKLERIVSRISFVSTTKMPENASISNITFSKFDFYGTHTIIDGSIESGHHAGSTGQFAINLPEFTIDNTYNADTQEIFFLYTFASKESGGDVSLHQFDFVVNFDDGSQFHSTIPKEAIKPTTNYKIIVKGPFLSEPEPNSGNLIFDIAAPNIDGWKSGAEIDIENLDD